MDFGTCYQKLPVTGSVGSLCSFCGVSDAALIKAVITEAQADRLSHY